MKQQAMTNDVQTSRWFYLFLIVHLLGWTLIPALVRYNLPLDSIEGSLWGHQLEWGYDKNPFLNAWLTALATYLGGPSGWMVYLFSQLSVIACFWAVWRIAKNMLPSVYALLSVLLLEGVQYYHLHAIDFNDNTLELSLWALTSYCFYLALSKPSYRAWLLTGFFAALGMMAKYYTLALLAGMALLLFSDVDHRKQLKTAAPYVGLLMFVIICFPHVVWLFYHQFVTVTYVFARASSPPSWTNHFFFPAQFAWQQLQAFLPGLMLFGLLFVGKKPLLATPHIQLSTFNKKFLFFVGLGPWLLTILLSFVLGIKLRAGWGMPLLSLWGIILFALWQPRLYALKFYSFIATIFILIGVLLTGYSLSLIHSSDASSANFPGQEIAQTLTTEWHEQFHTKLAYMAGSRWLGGNVAFYSADHPAVFMEWDTLRSPWIDVQEMRKKGAVFIWDIGNNESLPDSVKEAFPALMKPTVKEFLWQRNNKNIAPIKIGIAILPPQA